MKCTQCDNKVTMIGASVCSLKCACYLNGDNYDMVRARLTSEIALQKFIHKKYICDRGQDAARSN